MALIICPLQFEASALRRALSRQDGGANAFQIACCGPGAAGIERFGRARSFAPGTVMLLAGTAGAIDQCVRAGEAYAVDRVTDAAGESWTPPLQPPAARQKLALTSSGAIVTDAHERRALAQRSGAQLVDLESVAFARLASARGWRWGIVRGVSDDAATIVPRIVHSWIAPDGRTRPFAVLAGLLTRPSLLSELRCLRDNSRRALDFAAPIVLEMLRAASPRGA